jgi:hypothetical protein
LAKHYTFLESKFFLFFSFEKLILRLGDEVESDEEKNPTRPDS